MSAPIDLGAARNARQREPDVVSDVSVWLDVDGNVDTYTARVNMPDHMSDAEARLAVLVAAMDDFSEDEPDAARAYVEGLLRDWHDEANG